MAQDETWHARRPLLAPGYRLAFVLVTSLFLSWALAASLNDVLIRQFRKALDLSRTESSLVQFAFYAGYFCAALPAGLLIRRLGYKATMLAGLGLYAAGALLFYPAAETRTFALFLAALYTIAIGLALLETAANPYIAGLGPSETASARLNFAQAFYGIGAIAGGAVGARFIFSASDYTPERLRAMGSAATAIRAAEATRVEGPYLLVAGAMLALALLIWRSPFPSLASLRETRAARARPIAVLAMPRLRWAVVAQFFYVGGQVGVWSFFIDFTREQLPAVPDRTAALLFSGSLALLTLGRFSGAAIQRRVAPARLLVGYAVLNVLLCVAASVMGGWPAVACLWLTSFFMSIMYPTIFTLGVEGLGEETEFGASFLVMAIVGGALIPPAMALLADAIGGVHWAMLVPALCFAICAVYGRAAPRLAQRA